MSAIYHSDAMGMAFVIAAHFVIWVIGAAPFLFVAYCALRALRALDRLASGGPR
jgi:hypothetical protein